ncbi:MAG: efflux transporter outer membrane subunit [Akkermansiaceae bacterium]|jgi:multidrug efflux system outer membrane protein
MKARHLILSASLLFCSCMLGPDFKLPDDNGGVKWKASKSTAETHLPDDWWKLFNDPELNRLVDHALAANNDLAAGRARVDTARALVGLDRARLFPSLDLTGSANTTRSSAGAMPPGPVTNLENQNYRSNFDLAYDPDLWGRNKRAIEASSAEAAAAQALFDSQRLGIATEVARQYFLLRGLDAQHSVLKSTLKTRQDYLEIQKSRADAGLTDGITTSRAMTEVELVNNDIGSVERQRGAAENALAVLSGKRPADFAISHSESNRSLPNIRAGLPATVLLRRPDVRAAEQELRAANAKIGVAEAAFYPNFSLSAGGGFESTDLSQFLNWQNRVLSIGAGVAMPLIDGGTNKANYRAAQSRYEEALANYRQSLLIALREVEDAMVDLKGLAKSRAALERAHTSSQKTLTLSKDRFEKGLTNYFEVVDAERGSLQIQLSLRQIEAQQRITLAALAKALGGGWSGK